MLPSAWVDLLFAKLSVRYGVQFMRQYGDLDPALVKADWSEVLAGFGGEEISYGLKYLPEDRPPNAMQFRALCRRAPVSAPLLLRDDVQADPERVKAALERMAAVRAELDSTERKGV